MPGENNQQKPEIKPINTGTSIYDTETKKSFVIESFTDEDVNLRHIPRLRRDEPKNETWGWDELLKYFKTGEVKIGDYQVEDYKDLKHGIAILIRDNKIKDLQGKHEAISGEISTWENRYKEIEAEKASLAEKNANLEQQYKKTQGELDKIHTLREKKSMLAGRIELKREQLASIKGKRKQELQDEIDMLVDLYENL